MSEDRWSLSGACKDHPNPSWWFPISGVGAADVYAKARAICNRCPVAEQCLAHAIEHNETSGMWGGWTPEERRLGRLVPVRLSGNKKGATERRKNGNRRKLNDEQVREILSAIDLDGERMASVAIRYGVSTSTIHKVYQGIGAYAGTGYPQNQAKSPRTKHGAAHSTSPIIGANETGHEAAPTAPVALERAARRFTP